MIKQTLLTLLVASSFSTMAQQVVTVRCTVGESQCMQDVVLLGNAGVAIAANGTDEEARFQRSKTNQDTLNTQWSWSDRLDQLSMQQDTDRTIFEMRAAIKRGRVMLPLAQIDTSATNASDCTAEDCSVFEPYKPKFWASKMRAMGELLSETSGGVSACRQGGPGGSYCVVVQGLTLARLKEVVERYTVPTAQVSDTLIASASLASPPFVAVRGKVIKAGMKDGRRVAVMQADCAFWMTSKVLIGRPLSKTSTGDECVE